MICNITKIFVIVLVASWLNTANATDNLYGLGTVETSLPTAPEAAPALYGLTSPVGVASPAIAEPEAEFEIQWVSEMQMVKQCDEFGCRYVPKMVRTPIRVRKQRTVSVERTRTVQKATGGSTGNVAVNRTVSRQYGGSTGRVSYGSTGNVTRSYGSTGGQVSTVSRVRYWFPGKRIIQRVKSRNRIGNRSVNYSRTVSTSGPQWSYAGGDFGYPLASHIWQEHGDYVRRQGMTFTDLRRMSNVELRAIHSNAHNGGQVSNAVRLTGG